MRRESGRRSPCFRRSRGSLRVSKPGRRLSRTETISPATGTERRAAGRAVAPDGRLRRPCCLSVFQASRPPEGPMAHAPFPPDTTIHWRRLDVFGYEHARIQRVPSGWRLQGKVEVRESGVSARFNYVVECDPTWFTRSALVDGEVGGELARFALTADGAGHWTAGDQVLSAVAGALDIDLGFTPATNTLPIRRLALEVGESANVRSAWLRFPELRL